MQMNSYIGVDIVAGQKRDSYAQIGIYAILRFKSCPFDNFSGFLFLMTLTVFGEVLVRHSVGCPSFWVWLMFLSWLHWG